MKKYYIVKNGEKVGPYSITELQDLDINRKTLVWCNGLDNWVNAENLQELSEFLNDVPPPIPNSKNDSIQNIRIDSPIDVVVSKKEKRTKEEVLINQRKTVSIFLSEIGNLILYFIISISIAFFVYQIYFQTNKPKLVSEENQKLFNEEFAKKNSENNGIFFFGDIYNDYLGFYKFDNNLTTYDLSEINKARLSILKDKSFEFAKYVFVILLILLFIQRYIRKFLKWYNLQESNNLN